MNTFAMSDTERLILANQYKILGMLQKMQDEQSYDYENLSEALKNGHKHIYSSMLTIQSELSQVETDFVLDVLDLHCLLKYSFENLEDNSGIDVTKIHFDGFDYNNNAESRYLLFAEGLQKNDSYTDLTIANSHMPMSSKYKKMLDKWYVIGRGKSKLTKEEIQSIINF